jgi:hypothetical protein
VEGQLKYALAAWRRGLDQNRNIRSEFESRQGESFFENMAQLLCKIDFFTHLRMLKREMKALALKYIFDK